MLSLIGCSTVSLRAQSPEADAIAEVREEVRELTQEIPSVYLVECEWLQDVASDKLEDVLYWAEDTVRRYRECYILNNGKVDFLKSRRANR